MKIRTQYIVALLCLVLFSQSCTSQKKRDYATPIKGQWSVEKINEWYSAQPWLVGANYYPATAINQIDMWQASTWDPERIDLELSWAADMGMNTMRVYLHDLVWGDDEQGLYQRMDEFLSICQKYHIRPWFVFFDDCHYPNPKLGKQPLPVKGFHNSGWLNSPARPLAVKYANGKATAEEVAHLKGYVQKTIAHFKDDKRVLMWELYNEPGRGNGDGGTMEGEVVKAKIGDKSKKLVYDSWVWAREINPSQPITSTSAGSVGKTNIQINQVNSDLHSIHSYQNAEELEVAIKNYQADGRPVVVSEWLGRDQGSIVSECLPVMKKLQSGAINWGFVSGKSGTIWNWKSRLEPNSKKKRNLKQERLDGNVVKPGEAFPEPEVWFHDLLRMDGTPYNAEEIEVFKKLTNTK
ncbi:1,4-beta-xylanase [uncultured Algibacter sp.]|uniref:1,4-beta-xylanase n=1 Tax=uncultured Algibacter sp. TaxID=298659 RepID=UPI00261FA8C5|nr:1,4-beta-xylanase [uncultured Algibacter sp.]